MAGGNLPFGLAPSGELTAYTPTLREKAADWLRTKLFTDDRSGQDKANRLTNWAETMIPPFGFATQAYDAGRAGGMGDYGTAGVLGAMALVPGVSHGIHLGIDDAIRTVKIGDTSIQYRSAPNGIVELFSMRTPSAKRGKGSANSAMTEFLNEVDAKGLDVKLSASPLDRATKLDKLVKFYQKHGFVPTGQSVNVLGDPEMLRKSRGK